MAREQLESRVDAIAFARRQQVEAREHVREIVFVEGWVGPSGSSLLSLAPQWFADGIRAAANEHGEGWRIPPPAAAAVGVHDPRDADWLGRRLTDQPLRSFTEPTELEDSASVPARAVVATEGVVPFADLAGALQLPLTHLDGGHDLMITSPAALADALLETL